MSPSYSGWVIALFGTETRVPRRHQLFVRSGSETLRSLSPLVVVMVAVANPDVRSEPIWDVRAARFAGLVTTESVSLVKTIQSNPIIKSAGVSA